MIEGLTLDGVTTPRVALGQRSDSTATRAVKRSDLVASVLRGEIISGLVEGRIREGDPLPPERMLMERFNVARPTMRESMRILETDGLVELRVGAKGGAYIRRPSTQAAARQTATLLELMGATLADVWALRAELEPVAARMIAEKPSAEVLEVLGQMADDAAQVVGDPDSFTSYFAGFHLTIMSYSGSPSLAVIGGILHDIIAAQGKVIASVQRSEANMAKKNRANVAAQRKLLSLLEAGIPEAAETFWRSHMKGAEQYMREYLGTTTLIDAMRTI